MTCEDLRGHYQNISSTFTLGLLGNSAGFLSSADFFPNQLFQKIISEIPSECQTVWMEIRTDILSVLICVQNVCKGCQQTAPVGKDFRS